jgi:asparagine synthase (glutamine-hydrolysing)
MKRVQFLDIKCFMGELVLTKIDRASMANSIEVRVPFLDHQIAETVFSFPELKYIDPNQTKRLLFECIKDLLPNQVLNRKKQGFVGPDDYYMDQSFYRNLLLNSKLVESGVIKAEYVEQLLSKGYDWKLWKIAVMEKWFKQWIAEN